MYFNFASDWPALVAIACFVGFIAYLVINGKKNQKNQGTKTGK